VQERAEKELLAALLRQVEAVSDRLDLLATSSEGLQRVA
jgi:hypothetical protein